jgi:peptidoglycan hydrolase-like protein with peptidoglycan-binding domain
VARLQRELYQEVDSDLKVDSIFGSETERTVELYQLIKGLQPDAVVGPKTWHALGAC